MIQAVLVWLLSLWTALAGPPSGLSIQLLVFSKTADYRHEAIPDGIQALKKLGNERGWTIVSTEDAGAFEDGNLSRFDVVVFLMTSGDVLDDAQQGAFERFIRSGKGYLGIHSASFTEYDWPWYGELVGAYFLEHPGIQNATYVVEDRQHPAARELPARWTRLDEHYSFRRNPRHESGVRVLLSLDETSYAPGEWAMGDHPIVWCHDYDSGRAIYTALGHTKESYTDPLFLKHLEGAITWAAGR